MHRFILSILFLIYCPLQAEILEIKNMDQVYNYLKPNTLIIFDIDNTLIEPVQSVGSDQWFRHRIAYWIDHGMEQEVALEKALADWMAVQNITKMQLSEPNIAKIVRHLQGRNFTVMGLTTRGLGMSTRTNQQLATVGIDLSKTAPSKDDIFFMNQRGVLFREGTLFTANTHKGAALFKLLDQLDMTPKMILFINDKRSHIVPIEEWAIKRNIPFIGLRYSQLDEKVKNMDIEVTDIQFENFGHILSDDEAREILKERQTEWEKCPAA